MAYTIIVYAVGLIIVSGQNSHCHWGRSEMVKTNWTVETKDGNVELIATDEPDDVDISACTWRVTRYTFSKEDARDLAFRILNAASETYKDKVDDPPPLDACAHCLALDYCLRNGFCDDECRSRGCQ